MWELDWVVRDERTWKFATKVKQVKQTQGAEFPLKAIDKFLTHTSLRFGRNLDPSLTRWAPCLDIIATMYSRWISHLS